MRTYDIAIIGGSTGGVQAARAACGMGRKVYLCESTDWIGGQLTSQAVPPDENQWIEEQGATKSYLNYRKAVREAYRSMPEASELMRSQSVFCPGKSWVSRVAHSPRLAHRLLCESLQPYVDSGLLTIDLETEAVSAKVCNDTVQSVTVRRKDGSESLIRASYFLDATDCGDLLPMTGTEYRIGSEARSEYIEPSAPDAADSEDHQPITWVAALALDKERTPMQKPENYDFWLKRQREGRQILSWIGHGKDGKSLFGMFDGDVKPGSLGLWTYRRIQYPPYYTDERPEVTLLNWPQNDYEFGNVIDDPDREYHLAQAREQTLCVAYWLWEQGYNVRLDGAHLGTEDGLAKAPYIRESRRIVAKKTIVEQEVAEKYNPVPVQLKDSVGVGHYAMDLHKTTRTGTTMYQPAQRFEIPLSAMIPVRMKNLLPACKNIGATHLTGGCFRLHPVEWTIGEAAGYLSAYCLEHSCTPAQVLDNQLTDFQNLLIRNGFQLHWKVD
ncbi:MAG: FAD-dependent oxidoreductase [Clostridia bacterium]|nr:FAD-dependent oxidoreductase [Clostridia bacterium]